MANDGIMFISLLHMPSKVYLTEQLFLLSCAQMNSDPSSNNSMLRPHTCIKLLRGDP